MSNEVFVPAHCVKVYNFWQDRGVFANPKTIASLSLFQKNGECSFGRVHQLTLPAAEEFELRDMTDDGWTDVVALQAERAGDAVLVYPALCPELGTVSPIPSVHSCTRKHSIHRRYVRARRPFWVTLARRRDLLSRHQRRAWLRDGVRECPRRHPTPEKLTR